MKAIHEVYVPAFGLELLVLPVHYKSFKAHMNELCIKFFSMAIQDVECLSDSFTNLTIDLISIMSEKHSYDLYSMITLNQRRSIIQFQQAITREEKYMCKAQATDLIILEANYEYINGESQ